MEESPIFLKTHDKKVVIMQRIIFFIFLYLISPISLFAQLSQLQIVGKPEKMEIDIPDVRDINGRLCAVIQVVSDMEGFKYDSYQGVVKVVDLRGKDMVFLSPDERVLEIYHSGYEHLKIILPDIGIRLKSKQGWKITLAGDKKLTKIPVVINTYPDSVKVIIDDNDYGIGKLFMVTIGKHEIQLRKNDVIITDSITVDEKNDQFKFVLVPKPEIVFVKGGTFQMGDTFGDGDDDEQPVHKVTINDFYIAKYEVTFEMYDAFCELTGSVKLNDRGWGRGNHPVIYVRWYDAVVFCNCLSKQEGLTPCYKIDKSQKDPNNKNVIDNLKWIVTCDFNANGYRLATESEWEYAAKGGRKSRGYKYSGSNNIEEVAWYKGNSGSQTHPVGVKKPNELGIYDMTGNVREWCWDWYGKDYYQKSTQRNTQGPSSGKSRVLRRGSWDDNAWNCRAADRGGRGPYGLLSLIGFRLSRSGR